MNTLGRIEHHEDLIGQFEGGRVTRRNTKSEVLATAMTCRPRPFPCEAPSMIPGKSSNWISAPLYWIFPGIQVNVVNS